MTNHAHALAMWDVGLGRDREGRIMGFIEAERVKAGAENVRGRRRADSVCGNIQVVSFLLPTFLLFPAALCV